MIIAPPKSTLAKDKSPSHSDETRMSLLESGLDLLLKQGYAATSINDVVKQAGVPKGSFYYYFESKETFCLALLDKYASDKMSILNAVMENDTLSPLNKIRMSLVHGIQCQMETNFEKGCLIGVLGQELSTQSEVLREKLDAIYSAWVAYHMTCFKAAQASGEIAADANIENLVRSYLLMIQGAFLDAKISRNTNSFKHLNWLFFDHIGQPSHPMPSEYETILNF